MAASLFVVFVLGDHRTNDGYLICVLAELGQQFGKLQTGLSMTVKLEGTSKP